ncbi:MAG TPA: class I SAM-dependent methyltransferase [Myxococcota bacterium]|nr:class I SAM-dependent methyltransferase [Myxococcota bacterium]
MRRADDPAVDYRELVKRGYDRCAGAYAAARSAETQAGLELLTARLPVGSRVLDLGCGAGIPIAALLARRHAVTGIDFSASQIALARANVPAGRFVLADVMAVELPAESFDAVVAFYSIFHLPREEHAELLRRAAGWLAPGGYLLATVARIREDAYTEDDFFGVRMYWSNWSREDYEAMLAGLGFELLGSRTVGHGYSGTEPRRPEAHPLLFARKPAR